MPSDPGRQSRLDVFSPSSSAPAPPAKNAETPSVPAKDPDPRDLPEPSPKKQGLPPVTEEDRRRLRRAVVDGLEAAGFRSPRVTLDLKPHSGLRASLTQDRAGKIGDNEPLTLVLTDGYALAPERAVAGLAASLGLNVLRRRKVPDLARLLIDYHDLWQRSRDGRELQSRIRRARARKQGQGPKGAAHDLSHILQRLDRRFFAGGLESVELTWSSREGYTVLGHHDGDLDTIVINRCLDHADVPETVVAYILYHELLHHTLGIQEMPGGRRSLHPPSFRRRERRFPHWEIADRYLESMCQKRRAIPYKRAPAHWRALWDEPWDQVPRKSTLTTPAPPARTARNPRNVEEET